MANLSYPFNAEELMQKKRSIKKELAAKQGLIKKNIAIMSGSTVGEVKNILELFLLHYGIEPVFYEGQYGLFYENLLFDDGSLKAFAPDVIYIHTSNKNIKNIPQADDSTDTAAAKLAAEWARFGAAYRAAQGFGCPVIANNFEPPFYRTMGNKSFSDARGEVNFIAQLNALVAQYAAENAGFYVNDINYLSALAGLENWFSPAEYYMYKHAVAAKCIPQLCASVGAIIKSIFGKNKKSLILDLDNTLWGGVIGDDGPEGIEASPETAVGMAHYELQRYLKQLSKLGVMLNVASKNEYATTLQGFERDGSVLKRDDFIAFKANWEPKHKNIADIAQELNLMQDAFVFLDDNPAEREIVRMNLPAIETPELGAAEDYLRLLDRAGYFEVTALSADDLKRNDYYRQNMLRDEAEHSFTDYKDYLLNLDMSADILPFAPENEERVTQLINKTNQFNLTTRRYTAEEVRKAYLSNSCITLYGRLKDKFGDNGITAALIGSITGDVLNIDVWVMSCRVFKRELEYAMFDELVRLCAARGVREITGSYLPTAKNLPCKNFYDTIGFEKVAQSETKVDYSFKIAANYTPLCNTIKVN